MMLLRLLAVIVLPIALALPVAAQTLTEQDARAVFEKIIQAYDKAIVTMTQRKSPLATPRMRFV
jgi:hypothetical protein